MRWWPQCMRIRARCVSKPDISEAQLACGLARFAGTNPWHRMQAQWALSQDEGSVHQYLCTKIVLRRIKSRAVIKA